MRRLRVHLTFSTFPIPVRCTRNLFIATILLPVVDNLPSLRSTTSLTFAFAADNAALTTVEAVFSGDGGIRIAAL